MDKGNLLGGYALGDELLPDVLIDRKGRFRLSSGTASSKAWRVGLSSAFATFLAGRAWGVEMSQNTSWVSLSASPSRQICMMLSTH